ncbi:general transcription factor II-I repeat domain-containing protein 2-like [Sipha flava]|uniref:General transcription factor II-I repeat domain-containing protein 2-like n=1 Tax=Sipha flava TaxID=143950 RepID=A0A8B8GD85_9HEMI|nr:general transcription factor II-I repeat domain-containing protein 2-like [Sipha flava]
MSNKKRKIDSECHVFKNQWEDDYFCIEWQNKAKESQSFSDGEFVKKCMLHVIDEICSENKCLFEQVSLSRQTITRRIEDLGLNLFEQMQDRVKHFQYFSIALDESTDMVDTAQLLIFIRGVNANIEITEELGALESLDFENLVSITTDGAKSMIGSKSGLIGRINSKMSELNLSPPIGIHCIVHQQALCGKVLDLENVMYIVVQIINFIRSHGLNHRQFQNFLSEIESEYNDVLYHSNVRRGKILKRFFFLRHEIEIFLIEKNKQYTQLNDGEWLWDLAILTDITHHLNLLNLKLQGKEKLVSTLFGSVKAFQNKLSLFLNQIEELNFSHFESCATLKTENCGIFPKQRCIKIINTLIHEFENRFKDIRTKEPIINLFENPFNINTEIVEASLELEIIELQSHNSLRTTFNNLTSSQNLVQFYSNLSEEDFPNVRKFAAKMSCIFGSTYICEQVFSAMKINKSKTRSRITNEHLHAVLRVNSTKLEPNINVLCQQKQVHSSH